MNAVGRIPRNLFILPGGIAEIFTSTPGKHVVVFNRRRGIVKLALETGAHILPSYVFGKWIVMCIVLNREIIL